MKTKVSLVKIVELLLYFIYTIEYKEGPYGICACAVFGGKSVLYGIDLNMIKMC